MVYRARSTRNDLIYVNCAGHVYVAYMERLIDRLNGFPFVVGSIFTLLMVTIIV